MIFFKLVQKYLFIPVLLLPSVILAQTSNAGNTGDLSNALVVGITPDSRSGALGEAGVAISPDVNANYWNPAKLAFLDDDGASLSYNPWLRRLVPDVSMAYLSYAHKLSSREALGASIRYFNMGSIQLVDDNQQDQGTFTPNQFAIDASYARKFGETFSMALTLRYIRSNLLNNSLEQQLGNAVAADVSLFFRKPVEEFGQDATFAFGTDISNIGTKISYSQDGPSYFLPTNLRIGAANTWNLDQYNELTFTLDLNKLLVPTPPRDANGNDIVGADQNLSVPQGIFQSFSDAPGGLSEELQEITCSTGLEYWYNKQFALRAGYYYQNPNKGGRQYLTIGAGIKYDIFNLDFSYLAASQQNSPLANTLRFTLSMTFGGKSK